MTHRYQPDVMGIKPYQQIAIQDCGEPLVPIPPEVFAWAQPHPYEALGAPYGNRSPFFLRQGVLDRLRQAQAILHQMGSPVDSWKIQIFDAFRPIAVQQFMVDYSFAEELRSRGWREDTLSQAERQALWDHVHQFWAVPSPDPAFPPPHSTGAAVDVTLVDATGTPVEMGSPIDELSMRSYPDYFTTEGALTTTPPPQARLFHLHRQQLRQIMLQAGFRQHRYEWWHFSYGDQMWAWLGEQEPASDRPVVARYGRVD